MAQILGEMKNMELLEQTVTLKSALAPGQDQELEALADALAASVRGEQEAPEQAVADAPKAKGFICKICGFIYESDTLPEDFRCPICGRPASDFEPVPQAASPRRGTRCSSGDTSGETPLAFRAQPAGVTEAAVSPDSLGSAETTPETSPPVSTVTVEESASPPV